MPCPEPGGRCRAGVDGGNAIAAALEAQSRGRDHGTAFASPTRTARVATDACRTAVAYRGRLYRLRPGCGWGSMLHHIHATTGDKEGLFGYTLSREQKSYVEETFGFKVLLDDFTTADLGETCYDKIYSIGAMEHVRPDEILSLLRKVHRAVKPGGRLVQHFFSLNGNDAMPTSMVGSQLFFPGSLLSLHSRHLAAAEAGFRLSHSSEHDYRPTLRAWFDRLAAAKNEAANLVD